MKKLYDKSELLFSILWVVVYCVISASIRGSFGEGSIVLLIGLAAIAIGIFVFIKKFHLEKKYGLRKWHSNAKDYLYFVPVLILMTGNLWGGIEIAHKGMAQVFVVISMLLVGFIEELIFRGFLFRALLQKDPVPVAVTISAATFGIGHIVNLLTGQGNLETVFQILFAMAWGFLFTFLFYKTGSILVGVIVHGGVDVFSIFAAHEGGSEYGYVLAVLIVAIVYCVYLSRRPAALREETE